MLNAPCLSAGQVSNSFFLAVGGGGKTKKGKLKKSKKHEGKNV